MLQYIPMGSGSMLNQDIIVAQQIVSNKYSNINFNASYHEHSFIYKTTNEKTHYYQYLLRNVESLLCVTSSGDQILNAIAAGVKDIDCYDISVFPKYFLELKIAALKTLEKDEFIDYFFRLKKCDEFCDDIYDKVKCNLSPWTLKFWDSLYNFYDGYEIYNSTLFSSEPYNMNEKVINMPYLLNYDDLKNNIEHIHLNYKEGNIYDVLHNSSKQYDLINLSSIIYYEKKLLTDYKNFLLSCKNLKENGKVLTYLYKVNDEVFNVLNRHFSEDNFSFRRCDGDIALIYQKIK